MALCRVDVMNDLPETLEQLSARVDALERRIHQLEQGSGATTQAPSEAVAVAAFGTTPDLPSGEQVSSAFLVLGKSLLGIAGAYLLRALADANVLPRPLIAAVAIAYAIGWLAAASRAQTKGRLEPALFACTSALILAPMLWELTMRFQVLSPAASAAVLGLFVAAATALTWRKDNAPDFAVAYGAAAISALALSIVTHEIPSFLALLLLMLAVCEYKVVRSGRQGVWMVVASAADCAAWMLIVIYRTPASTRADYPALGTATAALPASLLFVITAAALVVRTAVLGRRITFFETAQAIIAFLLWVLTGLFLVPHCSGRVVGIACLVFASLCYSVAYGLFRRSPDRRNFRVFAWWSAGLVLAGMFLILPSIWASAGLAIAAVACGMVAARICCPTLECHGIVYLSVAALACGLLDYSFRALFGTMPTEAAWSTYLVSGCAVLIYAAAGEREGERWQVQLLHLVPALLAVAAVAALTAHGALWLITRVLTPGDFHVAFIRTLILCVIALALVFTGSRWRRLELKRLAYAALALTAAKLVFEDLRHGQVGFTAGSIFVFAITLIGVPRLARASERQASI